MPKTSIDLPAKRYFQTLVFNIGIASKNPGKPLSSDAIQVGKCNSNDEWLKCTGGSNNLFNNWHACRAGASGASVKIKCDPGKHNTKF